MISSHFIQSCQSGDETAIKTLVRTYQRSVFQLALSIIDDEEARPTSDRYYQVTVEAEAATRQAFITAIDRMSRYREGTNFETWLFGIAIQVSRRRARRWKIRKWLLGLLQGRWQRGARQPAGPVAWRQPGTDASESGPRLSPRAPEPVDNAPPGTLPSTPQGIPHGIPHGIPQGIPHGIPQGIPQDPRSPVGDVALWSSVRRLNEKLRVPVVLRYYHDFPIGEIAHLLRISKGTVHARLDSAREKIAQQVEHQDPYSSGS